MVLASKVPGDHHEWWAVPVSDSDGQPLKLAVRDAFIQAGLETTAERVVPGDWWNGRLVFAATQGDTHNIWDIGLAPHSLKIDGAPERITAGSSTDRGPVFSAAGAVAFSSGSEEVALWSMPLDNSGAPAGPMSRVPGPAGSDPDDPSVSADGSFCAYAAHRSGVTEIRVRNLASGQDTLLVNATDVDRFKGGPDTVALPFVSHDGTRVAYRHLVGKETHVMIVPVAGGMAEELCPNCGKPLGWIPRDKGVLLSKDGKIHLLDAQTRQARPVVQSQTWQLNEADVSPDSRWIAVGGHIGSTRSAILLAPWNDGNPAPEAQWIQVTDENTYAHIPRWSVDGKLLYFMLGEEDAIGALRIDARTGLPSGPTLTIGAFPLSRYKLNQSNLSLARHRLVFIVRETLANVWLRSPDAP
jgi:hypothetical protein